MTRRTTPLLLLVLAACSSAEEGPTDSPSNARSVGGVSYAAQTAIMESFPVQLGTTVTATNTTADAVSVTFPDGCIVSLRAYADSARAGAPAWDEARVQLCTMALEERTVPGGGSLELRGGSDAASILGDSLPDGRYWLAAVLRPDGVVVEVPAGAADLAVPR